MQLHLPPVLTALSNLEAQVLVFSFAPLPKLQMWLPHFVANFLAPYYQEHNLELPEQPFARTRFIADPDLVAYQAYGLGRNQPEEVYSREVLRQYGRWRKAGKPVKVPEEDPLQRGGDFVVNRAGKLTLCHTGHNQTERPPISDILAALA